MATRGTSSTGTPRTTKASKTTARKSTPAGRKSRSSPTRKGGHAGTGKAEAASATAKSVSKVAPAQATAPQKSGRGAVDEAKADIVAAKPEDDDTRFKRPDLIDAVAERTSMKRSEAKDILELVLEEMGKALDENEELVLPPLGKLMVKKRQPKTDGPDMLTLKLKRIDQGASKAPDKPAFPPLAAAVKDS